MTERHISMLMAKAVAITQARVGVVYRFTLDDGEKSTVLIDKNGDPLVFKSMWSCLNYMTLQGWQVLNISLEYKEFLFRREVPEADVPELTIKMLQNGDR